MLSYKEFMIEASSHYLVEPFTEEYDDWSGDYLYEYIHNHHITTFEDYDPLDIYLMIESCADGFWDMYNKSIEEK